MNKYFVYRFENKDGEIIYVGQTKKNLPERFDNHNHLPEKCYNEIELIKYLNFYSKTDADIAEKYFISKWKPMYNTAHIDININLNISDLDCAQWINEKIFKSNIKNNKTDHTNKNKYTIEAEDYTVETIYRSMFVNIPYLLIRDKHFEDLSDTAKILYSRFLNLWGDYKDRWINEDGSVYIIYTIADIMKEFNWSEQKITETKNELIEIGLIEVEWNNSENSEIIHLNDYSAVL
jgi:hypothetical protein